jgi:2-keto-4-pentenoate hydratase/2-oxohepta-3-ene-1,7-dioic acid hydratase in catechol pathway
MRFVRFRHHDGTVHTGLREGALVRDLGDIDPLAAPTADVCKRAPLIDIAEAQLDIPLKRVSKILALAGNYRKHATEAGLPVPAMGVITPQIFWKPSTALLRPGGTVPLRKKNVFFDWEAELAVIIGREARDVPEDRAMDYVFGYTIINDLSERKFNSEIEGREKRDFDVFFDWMMGKWFDGSAPLGPEIVTADEVSDPNDLWIRLTLNGERMQDSNTSNMIFKIAETISAISSVLTLERGDVIAMGTPEGVGLPRGRALRPGDHMQAEIQGLGSLDTYIGELE